MSTVTKCSQGCYKMTDSGITISSL